MLLIAALAGFRPPAAAGPIERDFEAYYAAGVTFAAGADPYTRAIWPAERHIPGVDAQRDELLPFVGPAAALPFWSLLARLPYGDAVGVWTVLLIAAVVVILAAALRIAGAPRDRWQWALLAGTLAASAPVSSSVALGQAALIAAAAVGAALVAYAGRRPASAILATLVAAVQPNLTVALIARIRSRWDAAVAAAAAIIFAGLTLAAGGGPRGWLAYLATLTAHGRAERVIAIQHTPAAIGYAFGLSPSAALLAGGIVAAGAIVAGIIVIVREALDPTTATLFACALLPLAMPFFHEQDFVLVVLPLLVLALRARGIARDAAAIAAALVLVDWFGLAQRSGAQAQILCLGLAAVIGVSGLGIGRPPRARVAGLVALLVLAALVLQPALAHRAPSWPADLPARWQADPAAPAAAVWAAEQDTSGLDTRDWVWGALRSLPLAGAALTAFALVVDARDRRRLGVGTSAAPNRAAHGIRVEKNAEQPEPA